MGRENERKKKEATKLPKRAAANGSFRKKIEKIRDRKTKDGREGERKLRRGRERREATGGSPAACRTQHARAATNERDEGKVAGPSHREHNAQHHSHVEAHVGPLPPPTAPPQPTEESRAKNWSNTPSFFFLFLFLSFSFSIIPPSAASISHQVVFPEQN